MKTHRALPWSTYVLGGLVVLGLFASFPAPARSEESDSEPTLVGRISYLDGKLLRFDNDQEQWIEAEKDSPFGKGDALSSDKATRAELMLPNRTSIRIGSTTQIVLKELNAVQTEIDLASGTARFYNKNSDGTIKVTTPFGFVNAPRNTEFDVYIDDRAVEVVALRGTVDFVHKSGRDKYAVATGSSSLIADEQGISSGEGLAAKGWDSWNGERDELWARQLRSGGQSARYLPAPLQDDGYVFDEYGRWDNVYYEGGYHYFWRPTYIGVGWSPFTVGRWMTWYGDYTWVPYEPFGYTTHHYGSWLYVGNYWYWAPPLATFSVGYGNPRFFMSYGWYPGRVGWIHHQDYIGWMPLMPYEPYYSHHHWGRHCRPVDRHHDTNVHVNVRDYSYADHAVIINQSHFRDTNDYSRVRVKHVTHSTIAKTYEATPFAPGGGSRDFNQAHAVGRNNHGNGNAAEVNRRGIPQGMPGLINQEHGGPIQDGSSRGHAAPTVTPRPMDTLRNGSGSPQKESGPVGMTSHPQEHGGPIQEGVSRGHAAPTVTPRPMDTLRNGSGSPQKETGPVGMTSHPQEERGSATLPVRENPQNSGHEALPQGKIPIRSKSVDTGVMRNDTSSHDFQGGAHTPTRINRIQDSEGTKGNHSQGVLSGHPAQSPAEPTGKAAPSGTTIREKQSPFQTQEPGKGNPDASPRSQGVPMRTNEFRRTTPQPRAAAEALPGNFRSSSSPRAQVQSKENLPYAGFSGQTTAPAYQPSSRGQNRVSSGGGQVRQTVPTPSYQGGFVSRGGSGTGGGQVIQSVPTPSYQGGVISRGGSGTGGGQVIQSVPTPSYQGGVVSRGGSGTGATVQRQYTPHGGTQGFVPQQGNSGGAGHGQSSSFGGMRRR